MNMLKRTDKEKIQRASNIGMWCVEFEEGMLPRLYGDEGMDQLMGVTDENITPEERYVFLEKRIHPDDVAMFADYMDKLADVRTEIVYRYEHSERGEMIIRCSGARDYDVTNCVHITGIHQDISGTVRLEQDRVTERHLADVNTWLRRKQAAQETYYRDLLDIQSCGLLAYTLPSHHIIHMNAEALRMYDTTPDHAQEDIGRVIQGIYYPNPEDVERLKKLRTSEGTLDYECILHRGTPKECHIVAKTKVFWLPSGERALVTTFLDVSDMVTLRNALRRAEEGNRAKSAFLFAMSHDLRTPMNAIIGYAGLMESHWDEHDVAAGYLQKLKQSSQFLLELIGNVLELSRIESGKETLHATNWDLRKIQEVLDVLMEQEIARKQLHLSRQIHIDHTMVRCDVMKMREIVMNLVSNAVKYTPEGGQITFSLVEKEATKEHCASYEMTVTDTGIGMGEAYIPHLFEAFSRERNSSESGIFGTGLGLKIVKSFVDLMDGEITVDSALEKGTTFTVHLTFPLAQEEEPIAETDAMAVRVPLTDKRILLVEDNELNAEITSTILMDAQMQVEHAADGEVALAMLSNAPADHYDLILMDIQMPRMNGYEATRAIRALRDERANIPIVAMTANAFEEDRKAAFEAGMDDYISKPVEITKLLHVLGKVLAGITQE